MAHNLEIRNGVTSFASTKTAWHGLGQIVDHAMTAEEAIKHAHLDYDVIKVPNYAYHNGIYLETPSSHSIIRTDTNQVLGDKIGNSYTIVQNSEAFSFFDSIVQSKEAIYETAGVLGIGQRIFITAKLPETIRIEGTDDITEVYVLLTSSHDGTASIIAAITPVRVVCANTLSMALNKTINKIGIRHSSQVKYRLEEAHKVLGISRKYVSEANELYNHLSKKYVSDGAVKELITNLFNEERRDSTRIQNIEEAVWASYNAGTGQSKILGTAWGALNGITYYLSHQKNYRSNETKFENVTGSSNSGIVKKATDLLLAL